MAVHRRKPEPRYRLNSEVKARELVEQAVGYGTGHATTFGGAWLDYIDDDPYAFASFVGPLDAHRSALDPRVYLVSATRTHAELQATAESARDFAVAFPVVSHSVDVDAEHGRLIAHVAVEDDARFERELRARFGSVIDLYVSVQGRRATPIEEWRVLRDGRTIEATWTGGHGEHDHRLDVEERDGAIHLTASCITEVEIRRAEGGEGPPINWASTLEGYERRASVTLAEPIGRRRILDEQRDRIDDHPPVRRSRRQRRDEDMLGIKVWEWVDSLSWAQGRGCEGPGENGWIRIYATVDDTERLRAAIVKKFGPGFEVVYQAPDDLTDDPG